MKIMVEVDEKVIEEEVMRIIVYNAVNTIEDALIKILEPNSMRNGAVLGWHSGLIDAVIDEIRKMLTIGGWISVKDRLPDKSGTYLCYQPKAASICALNTVRWSEVKGWIGKEVGSRIEGIEYWMPLPEPPEKEK